MSLTPNIELYKHDNVTTNTDQFDIDKALNKNWDKIDNEIGELQATVTAFDFKDEVDTYDNLLLKPKVKGDVWYCTENSTFYACNGTNWIPVNVGMDLGYVNNIKSKTIQCLQQLETPPPINGESLTLNDSKKGKFKSFEIRGNSEQEEEPSSSNEAPIKSCEGNINATVSDKNMFYSEMFDNNSTSAGITLKTVPGTNKVILNGTSTARFTIHSKPLSLNMFKIGNRYTASKDYSNNFLFEITENNSDTPSIWEPSFVMKESYTKIRVYLQQKGSVQTVTFNNQTVNLQIEEGDATTIIEHEEQTKTVPVQNPFRSIGEIRDHFIKQGGKRYEYHPIKRVILDGTESYTIANNLDGWIQFRHNSINAIKENTELMCNYFNYKEFNITYNRKYEAVTIDKQNRFRISFKDNTEITTVEQLKTWLAQKYAEGHPMYIDFVLAEPEKLLCTEEQNAVLQDIEDNLETYDDCTHIYSTDEVAPNFEVTYCKDVQKLFDNIAI